MKAQERVEKEFEKWRSQWCHTLDGTRLFGAADLHDSFTAGLRRGIELGKEAAAKEIDCECKCRLKDGSHFFDCLHSRAEDVRQMSVEQVLEGGE